MAPSPRTLSPSTYGGDNPWTGWGDIVTGARNRRGRGQAPRDSDLGFGPERMHSEERGNLAPNAARRPRSLSVGAEKRYGDWARSSVQKLLRQDDWLDGRTRPPRPGSGGYLDRVNGEEGEATAAGAITPRALKEGENRASSPSGLYRMSNSRHPAQVTQRRATPYATDLDVPLRQRVRRGGDGGGMSACSKGGRAEKTSPIQLIRPFEAARTSDLVRVASQADTLGLRRQAGSVSRAGSVDRGRTVHAPIDTMGETWGRTVDGLATEVRGWSCTEHGRGDFSSTMPWDDPGNKVGVGPGYESGDGNSSGFRATKRLSR